MVREKLDHQSSYLLVANVSIITSGSRCCSSAPIGTLWPSNKMCCASVPQLSAKYAKQLQPGNITLDEGNYFCDNIF